MFEHKSEALLPRPLFFLRMARCIGWAVGVVIAALILGACGYRWTEGMSWLDAFLNAAMILTGMGPVDRVVTAGGKIFAIFYAISSGFIVITVGALLLGPVLHRLLHALHLVEDEDS